MKKQADFCDKSDAIYFCLKDSALKSVHLVQTKKEIEKFGNADVYTTIQIFRKEKVFVKNAHET